MKYLIEHNRPECIACRACVTHSPVFWEMDDFEGKSNLKNSQRLPNSTEKLEISAEDYACNKAAADNCPVNIIHITDLETGEKII